MGGVVRVGGLYWKFGLAVRTESGIPGEDSILLSVSFLDSPLDLYLSGIDGP